MIKAVFFDIDDTLYSYTKAHEPALKAMKDYALREFGLEGVEYDGYVRQAQAVVKERVGRDCSTLHNRLIRFQCMLEILKKPLFPHAEAMGRLYWETLIRNMEEEPGAGELLKALKGRGYYVGIGTNMTAGVQFEKISRLGFGQWVDGMVTSEEAGVQKPDRKLFLLCAEKAGAAPEECVFVGDSLKKDVLGARAAGMEAILYWKDPCLQPVREEDHWTVSRLEDCLEVIASRLG